MKTLKLSSSVLLLLLSAAAVHARADVYTVPNGSFESPAGNNFSGGNPNLIPDFVEGGGEYYGVGDNTGYSPNAFVGSQHAFLNVNNNSGQGAGGTSATLTTANAITTFAPNTTYTLTVALGDSSQPDNTNYGSPGNQFFSFVANNQVVETFSLANFTLADGSSKDYSLTLNTANPLYAPLAAGSEALKLQVGATQSDTNVPIQAEIDNIRLTSTSDAPEPTTFAMLLGGLALLGFCIRRKAILGS